MSNRSQSAFQNSRTVSSLFCARAAQLRTRSVFSDRPRSLFVMVRPPRPFFFTAHVFLPVRTRLSLNREWSLIPGERASQHLHRERRTEHVVDTGPLRLTHRLVGHVRRGQDLDGPGMTVPKELQER